MKERTHVIIPNLAPHWRSWLVPLCCCLGRVTPVGLLSHMPDLNEDRGPLMESALVCVHAAVAGDLPKPLTRGQV